MALALLSENATVLPYSPVFAAVWLIHRGEEPPTDRRGNSASCVSLVLL